MSDDLRLQLYFLGYIAAVLFGARASLQWILSEKKKESHVTPLFWQLSLAGNLIMLTHSFLQLQFAIALVQTANGVISWRNLNLMGSKGNIWPKRQVFYFMGFALVSTSLLFTAQQWSLPELTWMRAHKEAGDVSLVWHLVGAVGIFLFATRFWVQWLLAEQHQKSHLGALFWWVSLIGSAIGLSYFIRIHDTVNIIGYGLGAIPFVRNLFLLKKSAPPTEPADLFLLAGETSGDLTGAKLAEALKLVRPHLKLCGVAGPQMREQGVHPFLETEQFQVMGFTQVIKALPRMARYFYKTRDHILKTNPKGVVLIDYPGFNLRLAKALRKKGYAGQIVQYTCPSVWAHGKERIDTLDQNFDLLLTLFPFEKRYFKGKSLDVTHVGPSVVGAIEAYQPPEQLPFPEGVRMVGLFPGSRRGEISNHLDQMLRVADALRQSDPSLHFGLPVASGDLLPMIQKSVGNREYIHLVDAADRYALMQQAECALAACGTVCLELALHEVPTVVMYAVSHFNFFIGRYLLGIRLKYFSLPNILTGKEVFPEYIWAWAVHENLLEGMQRFLESPEARQQCQEECRKIKESLTAGGSAAAAQAITERL